MKAHSMYRYFGPLWVGTWNVGVKVTGTFRRAGLGRVRTRREVREYASVPIMSTSYRPPSMTLKESIMQLVTNARVVRRTWSPGPLDSESTRLKLRQIYGGLRETPAEYT